MPDGQLPSPYTPVSPLQLPGIATPPTPPAGFLSLYSKADNGLYVRRSDGGEQALSREIVDRSASDTSVNVTSANGSIAGSVDLGVAVGWVHGTKTIEVRLETLMLIQGLTQAAALHVAASTYICDMSLASNGIYVNPFTQSFTHLASLYHVFHDTSTGFHTAAWMVAVAHVEAATGTQINLSGRAYQSLGSAPTWQSVAGATVAPIIMTARELL